MNSNGVKAMGGRHNHDKFATHYRKNEGCKFIGKPGTISIDYCDKCLRIHDGCTPGGCFKLCSDAVTGGGTGECDCNVDPDTIINIINEWAETNLPTVVSGWEVTPGEGQQNADDNILVITYDDGSSVSLPLYDDDGVVDVSWNAGDRTFTITFDDGSSREFVIGDNFARLSDDGQTIIFPDGRTWTHCCPREYRGTCGCDYPTNPATGALHWNGGELGCLQRFDGENWVNTTGIRKGDIFFCTETGREYTATANGPCAWKETTDSICLLPTVPETWAAADTFFEAELCTTDACDCEDDPNCDCHCDDRRTPKHKINMQSLLQKAFECLPAPARLEGCGTREQVIMQQDENGCWQLGVLSAAAKRNYRADAGNGDLAVALGQDYNWPADFPPGYTLESFRAADLAGTTQGGTGTLDENLMRGNIVSTVRMDLACPESFGITTSMVLRNVANIQEAYQQRTTMSYRWRVNGGPWEYPRTNNALGTDVLSIFTYFNGLSSLYERNYEKAFPAGQIEVQHLLFALNDETPAATVIVAAYPDSAGRYNGPIAVYSTKG